MNRRRSANKMGVTLRLAGPDDLSSIDALEADSFSVDRFSRRNLSRMMKSPQAMFLIAEEGARALGYSLLLFRRGCKVARLYSVATSSGARGQGVGTSLVRAAASCAIQRGCDRLRLEVRASNSAAIELYLHTGFRIVEQLPAYYGDGEKALRMELRVADAHQGDIK